MSYRRHPSLRPRFVYRRRRSGRPPDLARVERVLREAIAELEGAQRTASH